MKNSNSDNQVILEVQNLSKYFGKVGALHGVNLSIKRKEITSLIGPNGSGKTTLYNVVTGRFPPSSGRIHFKGKDIAGLAPHKIVKLGMARSFQITNIFTELTIFENIRSAVIARSMCRMIPLRHVNSFGSLGEKSMAVLRLLSLEESKDIPCSKLSYGDMRKVEIGIALATEPDLFFLDEPTAGMTPEETKKMVDLIKNLAEGTETTFFITEHDMSVVFSISDRIIVLSYGEILAEGTPQEIRANSKVRETYLGRVEDE
jgi:branched-chain amino acid transport system ATP-binding protein